LAAGALLLTAACSGGANGPGAAAPSTPGHSPSASAPRAPGAGAPTPPAKGSAQVVRTLAEGLKSPWGLARLPGGDLLVSQRDDGALVRIDKDTGKKTTIGKVPGVAAAGEGGLLGIALSPSFKTDHMVYAYFTTASDNRIVRMSYDDTREKGQQLGAPNTLLRGIPKGFIHNGGRIAFGPDGMLYAGTGEGNDRPLAQDRNSLGGKILRMTPDGRPAPGNPFGTSGNKAYVYSYGHRNVQGLAWDTKQRLWASEFGQDTWDELNLITPGSNDGWPVVEGKGHKHGYQDPLVQWHTDEASPSGIAYVNGTVWMAALKGERLWRIPLDGTHLAHAPQAFFTHKYGRLRTVLSAGGDRIWLITSNTDGRGAPKKGDDRILEVRVK
jgi:glucose/arabinose dehydrogenase